MRNYVNVANLLQIAENWFLGDPAIYSKESSKSKNRAKSIQTIAAQRFTALKKFATLLQQKHEKTP